MQTDEANDGSQHPSLLNTVSFADMWTGTRQRQIPEAMKIGNAGDGNACQYHCVCVLCSSRSCVHRFAAESRGRNSGSECAHQPRGWSRAAVRPGSVFLSRGPQLNAVLIFRLSNLRALPRRFFPTTGMFAAASVSETAAGVADRDGQCRQRDGLRLPVLPPGHAPRTRVLQLFRHGEK